MPSSRPPIVVALVGWTALVWTTRIGNIWRDHALDRGEKVGRTLLALSFTALAAVVLVALVRRAGWLAAAVGALAGWTTAVWIVRSVGIATGDHEAAFIAVHLVLAAVSIGLSALALRGGVGRPKAIATARTSSPQASEGE
jgi:hypothetical protein